MTWKPGDKVRCTIEWHGEVIGTVKEVGDGGPSSLAKGWLRVEVADAIPRNWWFTDDAVRAAQGATAQPNTAMRRR